MDFLSSKHLQMFAFPPSLTRTPVPVHLRVTPSCWDCAFPLDGQTGFSGLSHHCPRLRKI